MTLKCNIYILNCPKPLTVMLIDGIINPGLMHLRKKGIVHLCIERHPISHFLAFSTSEYAFSEGFETGILTTSDWRYCQFFLDTTERHTYITDPLV